MIEISNKNKALYGTVALASSKSISNRLLIIQHLCKSKFEIQNLSNSNDTKILSKILKEFQIKKKYKLSRCRNSIKICRSISCDKRRHLESFR